MGLTLSQRFGSNANLDTSTANSPKLVINLNDLRDDTNGGDIVAGIGLDGTETITTANLDQYIDKIFAALILLNRQNQPTTNTDPSLGVFIDNFRKRFTSSRGSTSQIEYAYTVNIYTPDTTTVFDPDDTVTV